MNRFKPAYVILQKEANDKQDQLAEKYDLEVIENLIANAIDENINTHCVSVIVADVNFDATLTTRFDVYVSGVADFDQPILMEYVKNKLIEATGYTVWVEDLRNKSPYHMTMTIKW